MEADVKRFTATVEQNERNIAKNRAENQQLCAEAAKIERAAARAEYARLVAAHAEIKSLKRERDGW